MHILVMDNRPFIIDADQQELKQYNRPDNTISYEALGYSLSKDFFWAEINGNNFKIPVELILNPEGISALSRTSINLRSHDENWGIYFGDEATARRLSGELPHIDIAGTDFTVDWRLREMRETAEPWKHISFNDLDMSDDGLNYVFFYDTAEHNVFDFNETVTEMPENVLIAEIPNEYGLDPVALARECELGEAGLLAHNPVRLKHSASLKPITGIGLEGFIEENKQRLSQHAGRKNGR
ncbi:hypothetical protein CKK33_16920 [Mucilaginibacter sp. MD40]|uniref:hypothetical protein n=1 Tax=Mucilaginibacter sp. MD40 TaxID=2029590 RepID=UPI000BACE85F|nr:hypothetical protein [Mucilaginibacter sp. MD40]PAW95085.1 hypothetical protein CKK33_16920 [Mucilaginibacter sp. MD40]